MKRPNMSKLHNGARIYPAAHTKAFCCCPRQVKAYGHWLMKAVLILLVIPLFIVGCASPNPEEGTARSGSPTGALLRGELQADEYLEAVTEANKQARADEQFELDKEPTRAFNTKTQRIEYVPEGTTQKWSEENQRWEFTPID